MATSLRVRACAFLIFFYLGLARRTQPPIVLQSQDLVDAGGQVQLEESEAASHPAGAERKKHLASLLYAATSALPSRAATARVSSPSRASSQPIVSHRLAAQLEADESAAAELDRSGQSHLAMNAVLADGGSDNSEEKSQVGADAESRNSRPRRTAWEKTRDITKVVALGSACLAAGFLALFYVTNFFEQLMHNTSGTFAGTGNRGPLVAGGTGLLSGVLHTLAGPDHFVGLMPMVVGQPISTARAVFLGALWGSGHAVGQLVLGMGFLVLQMGLMRFAHQSLLAENVARASGFLVGLALVSIGVMGVKEARDFDENQEIEVKERFGRRSFFTGVFHGLAPDSIVFLAPALALPRLAAILHVSGVFIGTLLAMAFCSAALKILCRKSPRLKYISGGASVAAILLGSCVLAASFGVSVSIPFLS